MITMPHKSTAFNYYATSSETSSLVRSVRVMRRNPNGSWHGDMLDGQAFVKAQVEVGAALNGVRVLLVGAGSAGAAITIALLHAGARALRICDADETRVNELIGLAPESFRSRMVFGPTDPGGCDMVCNATPMGLRSNDPLSVDAAALTPSMFVGDVISGHGVTPLLQAACRWSTAFRR